MKTLLISLFLFVSSSIYSQYIPAVDVTQNGSNQIKVHLKVYLPYAGWNISYTTEINQNVITLNTCYNMTSAGSISFPEHDIFVNIPDNDNYTLKTNLFISGNETTCDYHSLEDTVTLNFTTPIEGVVSLSTTDLQNQNEKPKVFPNPAKNVLNIKTSSTIDKITIYETDGKLILTLQKP